MSNAPNLTLNDKFLRLYGIPVSVVAFMLSQMPLFFAGRLDLLWRYTLISLVFTFLIWELSRWIIVRVRSRFPGLNQSRQRIGWTSFLFVAEMAIGQFLLTELIMILGLADTLPYSFFQIWLVNFTCALFYIFLIGSVYEAIYSFNQYKATLLLGKQLKTRQIQQSLDALKTRVNPHFLFNSLTTLSALIGEDTERAERFVNELAKVYRYLLKAGRQPEVTLGEELQFAESYSFLLKIRFEASAFSLNGLSADFNIKAQQIPALSLQNALDYLIRTQNTPLHIQLNMNNKRLLVSCTNHPKSLSFEVPANDWKQLETNGAQQTVLADQIILSIPVHSISES